MNYPSFFFGVFVGTFCGLFIAGLLGMAAARDRTMQQWQRLQRDYPLPEREKLP